MRWILFYTGVLLLASALGGAQVEPAQTKKFKPLAARIVDQRLNGMGEKEALQEQALATLDEFITTRVGQAPEVDLDALNRELRRFVTQNPPVGESYQLLLVPGIPNRYLLIANFSLAGPAAIRLYAHERIGGSAELPLLKVQPALVGRIDGFVQNGFFDENVQVTILAAPRPMPAGELPDSATESKNNEVIFLTVSGRTDELKTGAFAVWRWTDRGLERAWESELLQQSGFEAHRGVLTLTFCADTEDDRPRLCRRMTREKYAWRGGAWKRLEQKDVPLEKP